MPRLPGISQKEAVRVFQKLGYRVVRESGHLWDLQITPDGGAFLLAAQAQLHHPALQVQAQIIT